MEKEKWKTMTVVAEMIAKDFIFCPACGRPAIWFKVESRKASQPTYVLRCGSHHKWSKFGIEV